MRRQSAAELQYGASLQSIIYTFTRPSVFESSMIVLYDRFLFKKAMVGLVSFFVGGQIF